MNRRGRWLVVAGLAVLAGAGVLWTARARPGKDPRPIQTQDVIYGRKAGLALTLDVLEPTRGRNGAGVLALVSGGWFSRKEDLRPYFFNRLLARGYTIFGVVHGSQPTFTIPEIIDDVHRAVRFVRHHARYYHIAPDRLGIMGSSAGGHLSLLLATTGKPGDPGASDPVDRESSRVQAVAAFYPLTDLLNYGEPGRRADRNTVLPLLRGAFDFRELDPVRGLYVPITDEKRLGEITRDVSPITHVSASTPPVLLLHGDCDKIVPLQQSRVMLERLRACGVPAHLIVKKGGDHGWPHIDDQVEDVADWFDRYLSGDRARP